jgi:SAM-dependent methyltransferase
MLSTLIRDIADWLFRYPELRNFKEKGFDSAEVTRLQTKIYEKKPGIQFIYREYCRPFEESDQRGVAEKCCLEIGSGVSPLKARIPGLITSDVVRLDSLDIVCSAYALPLADASLDRIYMMFVLHHLGRTRDFLDEAYRCLKPGAELVIVDAAITKFSKLYFRFHIDKINTDATEWGFGGNGRMTDSNLAIPWMVFLRDRNKFEKWYPDFVVVKIEYNTCLAFLFSGGLRIRQLVPTPILKAIFIAENWLIRNITKELANTMAVTIKRR